MAKIKMMCPFSGRLCQDCSLYRGRHYYLCFCGRYRGCINEDRETVGVAVSQDSEPDDKDRFEIPTEKLTSAFDPLAVIFKEIKEGGTG